MTIVFEIIGTVAFAISGAITAAKCKYDLFGIITLGVLTATAGGILRDIILGSFPPIAFTNPIYVLTAAVTSLIVFVIIKQGSKSNHTFDKNAYLKILFIGDSIGLAVFTTTGINVALTKYSVDNAFLIIFSGVVTGVGGGVLRDLMVNALPEIFTKHIYAVASIIGGIAAWFIIQAGSTVGGIIVGSVIIVLVRLIAEHYRWNLPKL